MEFSQYPEAADDSIVPVVPDDTIDFPQTGADEVPGVPAEEYDEEELRELNRRSGKGLYVIVAIIALLAIAALAVGSTLLVQKNRSIETAEQTANPPPSPSPGSASVPTPANNTFLPTFGSTSLVTDPSSNGTATSGIGATEDGSNGVGDSSPAASGTSGEESDSSSTSGSDGVGANDEGTGGSASGGSTADGDVGSGNTTGGDASDSDVSGGSSGTLPGDLLGDIIDIVDIIDGVSPTSSPGGDSSTTGGSTGGSTGDTGEDSSASGSTNVDDGGATNGSGGSISSSGEGSTTDGSSGGSDANGETGETNVNVDDGGSNSGITDGSGGSGSDGLPSDSDETVSPTAPTTSVTLSSFASSAPTTSSQTQPPTDVATTGTAVDECVIGGKCSQEGSNCAIGTETCCGETFNSIECECFSGEWMCWATEACMKPDCGDLNTTAPSAAILSPSPPPSSSGNVTSTPTIPSVPTASDPSTSPIPFSSNQPTCSISIEVDFVTEEEGNLDETGYTLLSTTGSKSTTYMEVLPGDLRNMTSQNDVACVSSGAYIFTVYDESSKCCGYNKGYFDVKVNGERVVRGSSYFTSPSAYIIRTDYQPPADLTQVEWLNKHNSVREPFHTDNGMPFAPVVWSDSLAEAAAERASEIAPSCGAGAATDPWGENIGITTFGGYNEEYVSPDYVFEGWDNEENPLTFRQIMWRATRYVGCAFNITQMDTDGQYCHVAVCKYARPGNCNVNNETWLNQTLADYSKCDPPCPTEGCF